jgi:DNA-binding winged helix-turn-helix (wHTH) protein
MANKLKYPHKKLIELDSELYQAVQEYRFSLRYKSENAALRELIRLGLAFSAEVKRDAAQSSPQITAKALKHRERKNIKAVTGDIPELSYVSEEDAEREQAEEAKRVAERIGARR